MWDLGVPIYPPKTLPGFPNARRVRPKTHFSGGLRARWRDETGTIFEWDYQHGHVEMYDARGAHRGAFDPEDGRRVSGADRTRHVEP